MSKEKIISILKKFPIQSLDDKDLEEVSKEIIDTLRSEGDKCPFSLYKGYTVKEFIESIIKNNPTMWGCISIRGSYGTLICRYKNGEITQEMQKDQLGKKIIGVDSTGSHCSMDYELYLQR